LRRPAGVARRARAAFIIRPIHNASPLSAGKATGHSIS
jgi:hypothetical protein